MRSNISVGLPIDLLVYETDSLRIKLQRRIEEVDPYFQMVHTQWGEGLRRVFAQLPDPGLDITWISTVTAVRSLPDASPQRPSR